VNMHPDSGWRAFARVRNDEYLNIPARSRPCAARSRRSARRDPSRS
jgi:hypothetical protein